MGIIREVLAGWQHDEMKGNVQWWTTEPHSLFWTAPLWSGWTHTEPSQGPIYWHLHQVHNAHMHFKKGGVFAGRKSTITGANSHRHGYRDAAVTRALSVEALHPLFKHFQLHLVQMFSKIWPVQNRTDAFLWLNILTLTHTHTRTLYKLLITHLLIKYTLRKENKFFNVCQHRSP